MLKALKWPKVYVGTKVFVEATGDIGRHIADSMEASLKRLGLDSVDLYQLHNPISDAKREGNIDPKTVREQVLPAFDRLRKQGKARHFGFTALGDTPPSTSVLDAFDSAQVSYNMLNPSAGMKLPSNYPAQDYGNLIERAREKRRRDHRHPSTGGRRVERRRNPPSARHAKRGPDRLGLELRPRCGPRGAVR